MANVRAHVFVSGRVQGVFFRQTTKQQADARGVLGWVRNLPDGRVEAVFEGEEEAVATLVEFSRHGPSRAKVEDIAVTYEDYTGKFVEFEAQ